MLAALAPEAVTQVISEEQTKHTREAFFCPDEIQAETVFVFLLQCLVGEKKGPKKELYGQLVCNYMPPQTGQPPKEGMP